MRSSCVAFVVFALPVPLLATVSGVLKPDQQAVQGTWKLIEASLGESDMPGEERVILTVSRNTGIIKGKDGRAEFTFQLDPTKKPKLLRVAPAGYKKTLPPGGIYDVRDDRLRLCFRAYLGKPEWFPEKGLPRTFKDGLALTFQREKR